jgi:hypothetical protein
MKNVMGTKRKAESRGQKFCVGSSQHWPHERIQFDPNLKEMRALAKQISGHTPFT